jgi:nicotinate dehydrogenase subunit A
MPISLTVNGQKHSVDVDPTTPLLYVLSDDLALRGPKFGCGLGQCGCCTVIVRRAGAAGAPAPVRSCVTPVSTMAGAEITTLEGLGTIEKPHPIQKAFIDEQAVQCGFCLSGVILTAKVALDKNPRATDAQLRQELANVLCRCGTHTRMMKAIKRYQKEGVRA